MERHSFDSPTGYIPLQITATKEKRDHEENEKYDKENLCDSCCCPRNPSESKYSGNYSNDEKTNGPT